MSAEGTPVELLEVGRGRASATRSRPRARSGSRPSAPSGCAGPSARCPSSTGIDRAAARRRSSNAAGDGLARPGRTTRALLECLRDPARAGAHRRRRRRGGRRGDGARLPGRRQDGRGRSAQDRDAAASRSTCDDEEQVRAAVERIGAPVIVQPIARRRRRAAGGRRPGPGLRPARRLRPRRRLRRADRRRRLPDRAADRRRRGGARHRRQGRAGSSAGFRGAPPADVDALTDLVHRLGTPGRGPPRGRRARPQPGARRARRLRRGRRARPPAQPPERTRAQELVAIRGKPQ